MRRTLATTPAITQHFLTRDFGRESILIRSTARKAKVLPKILLVGSYLPRQCGIATYTYDLKNSLDAIFRDCFTVKICALASAIENHTYDQAAVESVLNTDEATSFDAVAKQINADTAISLVMVQHEFGLFKNNEEAFLLFLTKIKKPLVIAFHTVLPKPNTELKAYVKKIVSLASEITVMTNSSAELLQSFYQVAANKITIIPHGTHLVEHQNQAVLKSKYKVKNRKVLSTFGFLGPGKSIETTLAALPAIIEKHQEVIFLIVGKTHPTLFNQEGNAYKQFLQEQVIAFGIENHVRFIDKFVPLPELLEYLQLSDCYIFTSKDPNQAVSGTFSYAVSCGCPIVSTPIPHAKEVLKNDNGFLFDFLNADQLADRVVVLLDNEELRNRMKLIGLHSSSANSWQNAALKHAETFSNQFEQQLKLTYKKPEINISHLRRMTTEVGILQFSKLNTPDLASGYTLDDNARALLVAAENYNLTRQKIDLQLVQKYLHFVLRCQRENGLFLNYLNVNYHFTDQNYDENLEDSNGRAIWALGYTYHLLNDHDKQDKVAFQNSRLCIYHFCMSLPHIKSPRALAFIIKGLYYFNLKINDETLTECIREAALKLTDIYDYNADAEWEWFEPYLTYANAVLPEALLLAWKATGDLRFKFIAQDSFDFLLSQTFTRNAIQIISNRNWLLKGQENSPKTKGGEQPIDVAYTILALKQFNHAFPWNGYHEKMDIAFSWFLGNNHLKQFIYNPRTGGCHDGIETSNVNLNQGAESTLSYLLARMAFEQTL
jgi:glycosyltransferase involved in cell wall biosynthesis